MDFFFVRKLKFYSFSKFQSYDTVLSTKVTRVSISSSDLNRLPTKSLYPFFTTLSLLLPLHAPAPDNYHSITLLSVSVSSGGFFLDFTCKWCYAVFSFLSLAYFMKHNALQVYPGCQNIKNPLLFQGWIIFRCVCVCVCV